MFFLERGGGGVWGFALQNRLATAKTNNHNHNKCNHFENQLFEGEGWNSRQWKSKKEPTPKNNINWLKQSPMFQPEKRAETLLPK